MYLINFDFTATRMVVLSYYVVVVQCKHGCGIDKLCIYVKKNFFIQHAHQT